jgi:hypothetical protein
MLPPPHVYTLEQKQFKALFNTNLKDPIRRSLQSYLCRRQFRPEVEGRAVKSREFTVKMLLTGKKGKLDNTHLEAIVSPTAKFHFTTLIIERKPRDIDFTRRLENPWWHI